MSSTVSSSCDEGSDASTVSATAPSSLGRTSSSPWVSSKSLSVMSALLLVFVVDHFGVDDVLLRVVHVARARLVRGRVGVLPGRLGGLVDRLADGALALVQRVDRRIHRVVILARERRLQRVVVVLRELISLKTRRARLRERA